MNNNTTITVVSVHSPLIQYSTSGSYYTSYAISLKTNDPCFTQSYSQTRRRYSEFLNLRSLLASHYPTIKPPALPPKNYFHRFSDALIEERKVGLQKFLEQVLSIPVYLSDKSLHLFLQTSCSMNQIGEECIGDIPAPQLMDYKSDDASYNSDESSILSSSISENISPKTEEKKFPSKNLNDDIMNSSLPEDGRLSPLPQIKPQTLFSCNSAPKSIPRKLGSLESSPASSLSSLDASYSSLDFKRRRVSFNQHVTVAVVYNQLWNIGTKPIRTDA